MRMKYKAKEIRPGVWAVVNSNHTKYWKNTVTEVERDAREDAAMMNFNHYTYLRDEAWAKLKKLCPENDYGEIKPKGHDDFVSKYDLEC